MKRTCTLVLAWTLFACDSTSKSTVSSASGSSSSATSVGTIVASVSMAVAPSGSVAPLSARDVTAAQALKAGRKLAQAAKWKEAVASLKEAVSGDTPDARAYSELGWAALNSGDLSVASDATSRGLELTKDPKLVASLLYNRGRIEEAREQKDAAAKSYKESLALRDNDTVRRRLESLGEAAPPVAPPPPPKALCAQTFSTLRDACVCLLGERATMGLPAQGEATCVALPVDTELPSHALEIVRITAGTETVVWVLADVKGRLQPVTQIDRDEIAPRKLLSPLDGDKTVLSLLFDTTSTETGKPVRTTAELFCLVGDKQGAPRCPLEVPHAVVELLDGHPNPDRTATFSRSLSKDGKVTVKAEAGPKDLVPKGSLGSHALF